MGGAYAAIAEASPASPDVPPGWNPDWSFIGPLPPGYTMELSLDMTADDEWYPSSNFDSTVLRLYDHETYKTNTPTKTLTWTAETRHWLYGSTPVDLKLYGEETFVSSVTQSYDSFSGVYGKEPEFDFDKTVADAGETVYLLCTSSPFDDSDNTPYDTAQVTSEEAILIRGTPIPPRVVKIEASLSIPGFEGICSPSGYGVALPDIYLRIKRSKLGESSKYDIGTVSGNWGCDDWVEDGPYWSSSLSLNQIDEATTTADDGTKITATNCTPIADGGHTYFIKLEAHSNGGCNISGTFWGKVTYADGSSEIASEPYELGYYESPRTRYMTVKEDGSHVWPPFTGWNP